MRPLAFDVARFARRQGLRTGVEAAGIIKIAREVLKRELPVTLQDTVLVTSFSNGKLVCTVQSGSAAALVQQYRGIILNSLKRELGRARVEKLIIKTGTYS